MSLSVKISRIEALTDTDTLNQAIVDKKHKIEKHVHNLVDSVCHYLLKNDGTRKSLRSFQA